MQECQAIRTALEKWSSALNRGLQTSDEVDIKEFSVAKMEVESSCDLLICKLNQILQAIEEIKNKP